MKVNLARRQNGLPPNTEWSEPDVTPRRERLLEMEIESLRAVMRAQIGRPVRRITYRRVRPPTRQRNPVRYGALLETQLKLEGYHGRNKEPLTPMDLFLLSSLVDSVLQDRDPRELVWSTVTNRPRDPFLPRALALYVVLRCPTNKNEKRVKSELTELGGYGFTPNQIKHALTRWRAVCEAAVSGFTDDEKSALAEWNLRDIAARVQLKKSGRKSA